MTEKKNQELLPRVCPICGRTYTAPPAISRTDNRTPVCPDCGIRQSLESIGVSLKEQEEILKIIHKYQR